MRRLLSYLLIMTLAFPWEAYAQTASTLAPTDPNYPGVATMKSQLQTKIVVPSDHPAEPSSNPNGGAPTLPANNTTTISVDDLSFAQNLQNATGSTFPKGCNPVVWASLIQRGRNKTLQEVMAASGIHNQTASAMNNQCRIAIGPNGENRLLIEMAVADEVNAELNAIEAAICSLNWSKLASAVIGININICKNGQLIGGGVSTVLGGTFLAQLHNLINAKNCLQAKDVNSNLMQQAAGSFGTNVLGGAAATAYKFDATGAMPGGGGFSFGASVGAGVGLSTSGVGISGGAAAGASGPGIGNVSTSTNGSASTGNSNANSPVTVTVPSGTPSSAPASGTTPLNIYR